jgi:hypothetical protein
MSGLVIVLAPAFDTTLSLGLARVVYAAIPSPGALPARFLDAVGRWGEGGDVRASTFGRAAEQLTNVFGRWIIPESGIEAYVDWARVLLPKSFRALLVAHQISQGYTVGSQWLSPSGAGGIAWRAQVEFTMLEQAVRNRLVAPPSFYVSPVLPQGLTHRGQVTGASIGPGSSSQWLALDRMTPNGHHGVFLGRIRWDNDAYYRQQTGFDKWAHDVSFLAGVRAGRRFRRVNGSVELLSESRLNYLFQNIFNGFGEDHTFDVHNLSLRLSVEPIR